ncbi:MAG: hypothetical protein COT81_03715 [Candidatus Buchananbacteria bacterium CG10_big_fil_rev_8_21_14_0_10_42_9]|uniref:Dipeptidylpeptidase IV N-terminal domain-containing protein n=1 Tax=Candidatus Buchananbacteria bacterium CG10_big_fil_rev_8_21_14_0_10_42_9 TaxID=1974526 RepID=A0A2H0W0T2_9BACT|nr:MAG: hypothetical protein COT81_03715 [Candidatus Buchananbacteria bacterium CG10_big_fil_rev_8_21_14_0_10_42_9]
MPNLNWRLIGLISAFLGAVVIIGYVLWLFFFRPVIAPAPITNVNETPALTNGGLPVAGPGGQIPIIDDLEGGLPSQILANLGVNVNAPVEIPTTPTEVAAGGVTQTTALTANTALSPALSSNGLDVNFYDPNNQKFFKVNSDGILQELSDQQFSNVQKVSWAPSGNRAILEFPDNSKVLYDFSSNKQITLPSHWEEFSFAANSGGFAFKNNALDPEDRWLAVSNLDGTQTRLIQALGNNGNIVDVNWSPNNQMIGTYTKPLDGQRQNLFFLGFNGENFKKTIIHGYNFKGQWSPTGKQILYSVSNAASLYQPSLWIVDAVGDNIGSNRTNLGLSTTADKCHFASNTDLYCAVATEQQIGSGIEGNEPEIGSDVIVKVNLNSGSKSLVAIPNGAFNISNIVTSDDDRYLYFTESTTGQLYNIKLR